MQIFNFSLVQTVEEEGLYSKEKRKEPLFANTSAVINLEAIVILNSGRTIKDGHAVYNSSSDSRIHMKL